MNKTVKNKKTYLFLFPRPVEKQLRDVRAGKLPSEIFYGAIELIDKGWEIKFSDSRYTGRFGKFMSKIKSYGIHLIDFGTIKDIASVDVVVVKDEFSILLALTAKLLGKKIIFFDSMFKIPKRLWRRFSASVCLSLADRLISFSAAESALWQKEFGFDASKLSVLKYAIDLPFYTSINKVKLKDNGYILSIGRDLGRDFSTLVKAIDATEYELRIVTLPYLLEGIDYDHSKVKIYQYISYEELFELYSKASMVVVPLKKDITYASGIRGLLEAMALEVPTVVSKTIVLEQYFSEERGEVIFYEPENPEDLRRKITALSTSKDKRKAIASTARKRVDNENNLQSFATELEQILLNA